MLSPSSLAVLGVLALLWVYVFIVRKDPLVLGGRTFRCAHGRGWGCCCTRLKVYQRPNLDAFTSASSPRMVAGQLAQPAFLPAGVQTCESC